MKIDNSRAKAWWECPLKYWERYENNLEPATRSSDALSFGTRMHQLLECRHHDMAGHERPCYPELDEGVLEAEAQLTLAAYEAYYPEEPWEVVDVERYFEVPVGTKRCYCRITAGYRGQQMTHCETCDDTGEAPKHVYCGEFDAIVRMRDSGRLWLLETKTEKRGGKDNLPESWQQKSQVGLYLWAAEKVYGEEFEGILLNVVTRQSPKGQEAPIFRRDHLVRTPAQQLDAVKNLVWVADQIEAMERSGWWPTNRNHCVSPLGWKCDYMALHSTEERSEELVRIKFKQAEEYLSGL